MSEMKIVGAEEAVKNADAMLEQNKAEDAFDEYKTPISDMLATIPQYGKAGEKEQYIVGQFAKGEYTPQTDEEWNGLAPLLSRITLGSEYDEGGRSLGIFMQTEDFTTGEEYKDVDREHGVANAKRVCETWKQWFEYARSGDAAQLKFIQDNSSDKDFYEKPLLEQERIARRALGKGDAKDWDAEHSMMTEELFDASAATQAKAEANGIMLHMSGDEVGEDGTGKTFTETAESAVDARAHADIEAYRRMVGDRYGVAKLDAAINILTVPNMDGTFGPDEEAVKLLSAFAKGRGVDSFGRLIPGDYLGLRDGALNLIEQAHAADRANGDGEDGPEYKKAWASVIRAVRAANLAYKTEGFSSGPDAGVGGNIVQEACNGLLEVEDLVSGWIDGAWHGTARAYNKVANTVWRTEAEAKDDMERRYIDDAAIMATTANVVPSSTWYGTVEREAMKFAAWGRLFGAATWTMGKFGVKAVDVGAKAATFDKAMKDIAPLQKAINESYAAFGDAMGGVQDLAKAGEIGESILNLEKAVNDARAIAINGVGYNGWAQIVDHTRSILTQAPALLPIAMSEYESSARGGAVQMTDLVGLEEGFDAEKAKISDNYALGKSAIVTGFMSAFSPLLKQMAEGTVGTSATQRAASALLGAFSKAEKNGDVTELRAWLTAFAIASAGTLSPAIHSGFMIGTQNATLAVVDEFETASLEGRPVDMDAMAARATEAGVDGATAGFLGALPAAAVGSTYSAASMKLPTIARAHKIDYSAKRVISALGGLDYDSTLRRKTYSELTDAEKARFNKGNKEFSAIIQAIVNEGDGADAAAREELLKKHGVPAHLHGTLDSLAKDVAFAAKNFRRNAITMAAVLEGSKAYSTDAEAEDYLRRAGFDAKITTGEDGVKRIELGATVRGKKVSGTFLMEHGEVLYRRDDGSYMPGAAKAIVQWTEENSGQSDIAHVAEKLAALKGDTATDANGKTKYDRLIEGEDVDGLLTEMRKKMGGKGATGVFVAPDVAKDDPNAAKATRGGAVKIEGGLIKLAEGDIETLIHEPTHALIDLLEKAGAITEDERKALEAVQGLEGWNEELTRRFGIDASGKVIAQKAVEIAAENNRGLVERIKDGAAKLLGVVRKVKAVNGNPVAMFGEFFDDAVEAAEKDAEERAVDEERGKQLEKAAAEAEKAAREAIGDPIATDEGEAGPTEEVDLTLEEMAERDEIAPERREGTPEASAAPATETPAREAERAPDAIALAQEAIAYRNGISDELFEGGARGFLDEFTDGGKLTVEQVMGALGYAHDAENGVWLHRDTAAGAYDRAVAREAQRKLVAGEELSEAERRRVGVIVDGNGVMAGVGIRIDGEIDGTEEAVDENMRGLMAQAGSSWRALAVNESKEVVDAVRRQLSTETAKFLFVGPSDGSRIAAEEMEKNGASAAEIYDATLLFRGADGKWRIEMPSLPDMWKAAGKRAADLSARIAYDRAKVKVDEFYKDNADWQEIVRRYPEAKNIYVQFVDVPDIDTRRGAYDRSSKTISIRRGLDDEQSHKTFIHELQHAIQREAGFAAGANAAIIEDELREKLQEKYNQLSDIHEAMKLIWFGKDGERYSRWIDKNIDKIDSLSGRGAPMEEVRAKLYRKEGLTDLERKSFSDLEAVYNDLSDEISRDEHSISDRAFEDYWNSAGEVEARNSAERERLSMEERMIMRPWATEDVPRDKQIVRFNFKPGKTKDWFTDATAEALGRNEADWTKYDTREDGFNKMSRTTRLAEAVGTMDEPSEIWKVFLPTGKKDHRYKNFLIRKFDENGVDGNDKMKSGGYHMLNHIAECGYYGGKSVLTAQEMNDYFLKCLDTKAVAQPRGRLAHELRLPNGTKMTVVTYVDTVNGENVEIPITITSDRNDYQSRGACKDAAKKMSARLFVRSSEESDGKDRQTEDSIAKQEIRVNGRDYTMLGEPLSKGAMTKHVGPGIDRATGGYPVMAPQIDPETGEPYPGYENAQSMFNWVGRRGLANALKYRDEDGKPIVTQAKLDKIEKMAKEYYEEAVRRLGGSGGYYDEEGNYRRRVRNWMVERDLGEKGFDIGLPRVGSDRATNKLTNRLRLHFTGAYKDNAPRFEYAGAGAKLKIGQEKSISEGGVSLQDIVKDADMKAYYPEIAEAPVVMGGKRGFALGTVTLRGLHKNGAEATKDNSKGDKIEVIVPDRTGRERMVGVSNDGVFIIFADEITKANRKQIEQDMNAAVAAAISRYEGWDFASKYGETYDPNGVFTARDWGRFASSAGRRTFFGKWLWSQSNSEFKYHLFGDAKLDMNNPDSVAAKVVQKVIDEVIPPDRKTKGRTKERREVREQIREEIVKMLNGTYEDFASVLEAKAMGARMGRKWERLSDPDEGLYDADRRGFIRARQGGWSEESSRRVIEYWQRDVAEAMARILKDAEVADMFRKYFDAEVKARDFAGKVAAAVRKVNPTGARTKKMLAAVNKERAKLGMETLTEAQWENWYSLGGTSDQVGRPSYTEEQKRIAEANAKKVTPFWNTGTTDSKTATENRGASGRGASRTGAATDAAAQGNQSEGLTIEEREAANAAVYGKDRGPKTRDTDTWKANEGKAFDELKAKFAEMNAKDADAMKAAVKEAVRIVMKYSGQGVSEQAIFERAQGLFQMITTGKKPSKRKGGAQYRFVGADFTTRMIGASASKLAYEMMRRRRRPDGMANAVEAVKAQMKKEAARLKIPQADRDLWADTVVSSAKGIAEDVVDSMGDRVDAKARDITKDILDRVEAEAEQRRISSAMYSQLLGGYVEGRRGEEAVETAHASLERERMAAIRAAKGLTVGEVNSVVGFDTIGSIVGLGSEGARFKDGAEMAKALTAGFLDGYRRANPEAATAMNDELLDDPSVRREYAQTVGSLINAAAKRIAYGRERTLAARDAATLRQTLPPTLSTIERMFAHHADMIADSAQKLDVASLVKTVERIIDSQAAGGKRVSQNASKWERDIAPHLQEFWKYVKDVMYKSESWCADEETAIKNRLKLSEQDATDIAAENPDAATRGDDIARDLDMMKLRAIRRYGALTSRDKAEVVDIIGGDIIPGIDRATREYLEYRAQRRADDAVRKDVLIKGLKPYRDGDYKVSPKGEWKRKFLFWNMPDMFAKFSAYFKEGSDEKMLVDGMRRDFSTAHLEENRIVSDLSTRMVREIESVTGMRYDDFIAEWTKENPDWAHLSRSDYAVPSEGGRTVEVWTGRYAQRSDAKKGVKKGDKVMRTVHIAERGVDDSLTRTAQSKLSLMYAYAAAQQGDMEINNVVYSRDAAWMREVEGIIGRDGIALASRITAMYDTMRGLVSPVSERITGAAVLSPDPRYCPLFFEQRPNASMTGKFSVSKFPTFLTEREKHDNARLQEGVNILDVLTRRIRDTAHYTAFGELADKVKTTFADGRVMAQYYNVLGQKTAKALYRQLNDAFNGGEESLDTMGMTLRNIVTHTTLGYNPASAIKQLEGIGGWKLMMGTRSWIGALTWDRSVFNTEVQGAMADLAGVFAARGNEGITEPMRALMAAKERNGNSGALRWYTNNSMAFTRFFDKVAVSTCAAQYYLGRLEYYRTQGVEESRYTSQYAMYKRSGWAEADARRQAMADARMTPDEAKRAAVADTDYAIQITQTSGRQEFLNEYQRSGMGGKIITQFAGPRFTRLGIEIDAAHRAFVLGEKGAKVKFLSKFFTGHVICPAILATASQMTSYLFGRRDDKNARMFDGFMANMAVAMAFGPWSGMCIIGSLLDTTTRMAVRKAMNEGGTRRAVEFPMTSKLGRMLDLSTTTAVDACRMFTADNMGKEFMRHVMWDLVDDIQALIPVTKIGNAAVNVKEMIDRYLNEAEREERRGR